MALVIKKKAVNRTYKGKSKKYYYYELHKVFRDPQNWKRVISKYLAHLGSDPKSEKAIGRIRRYMQESQGNYSMDRLTKKIDNMLISKE